MNSRLKQFMAAENITQSQLADNLNVVRASVSHILSGRNNPSYEFIKALMSHYPSLNMEWLMFGKGKMYTPSSTPEELSIPASDRIPPQSNTLFFEDEESNEDITLLPSTDSNQKPMEETNKKISTDINTLGKLMQSSNNQRKVVRVMILFDDGTYQEL